MQVCFECGLNIFLLSFISCKSLRTALRPAVTRSLRREQLRCLGSKVVPRLCAQISGTVCSCEMAPEQAKLGIPGSPAGLLWGWWPPSGAQAPVARLLLKSDGKRRTWCLQTWEAARCTVQPRALGRAPECSSALPPARLPFPQPHPRHDLFQPLWVLLLPPFHPRSSPSPPQVAPLTARAGTLSTPALGSLSVRCDRNWQRWTLLPGSRC